MNKSAILRLDSVYRSFKQAENKLEILRGVTFSLNPGEIVALVGPSGIGKSTLLHVAGLLEKPNKGDVFIGNRSCGALEDSQRTKLRNTTLGFIYQFHHLLPEFTAQENVILPQIIGGKDKKFSLKRAVDLLELDGLSERRMRYCPCLPCSKSSNVPTHATQSPLVSLSNPVSRNEIKSRPSCAYTA